MKPIYKPVLVMLVMVLCLFTVSNIYAQTKVVIPGTFQSELGCSGDWMPDCDNTALTFNSSTGLWTGTFNIPKGCYQYKVALDGNWNVNYGEGGIYGPNLSLYVPEDGLVTFNFNLELGVIQTTPYSTGFSESCLPLVVLAGSFQDTLGCNSDWDASCTNTSLIYVPATGQFENDLVLPAGYYEYRAILNNDWTGTNYGSNGRPDGSNYFYYTACQQTVHFSYNPVTHLVNYSEIPTAIPAAVVIAGSFQSEMGCAGDWLPDCNTTSMQYDEIYGLWTDTLDLPAGHWEFKIAINNSWDENYGLYNAPGGANIPLDLCYPAKVAFSFSKTGCYVSIFSQIITNGICANIFYDANVNANLDPGEEPMGGIKLVLTGDGVTQTQTTGTDGKATFTNLPDGFYTILEELPSGYMPSYSATQGFYLFGSGQSAYFGNFCLGPGTAKDKGFWIGKYGEEALANTDVREDALAELRYLSLRNTDGTDFDPTSYDQLRTWLKAANAKNIANMLSAELATLYLSRLLGYISYESFVYTSYCWNPDNPQLIPISVLIGESNFYLTTAPVATGNDPNRDYLICLKETLADANNNLNYVQPHPCSFEKIAINKTEGVTEISPLEREMRVLPNPSKTYFTLRPSTQENNETVELKVFNIYGQQVYRANGSSNRNYHFGERFTPGVYLAEIRQGSKKTVLKLVKQ